MFTMRRRERQAPDPERVERRVEDGVQAEVAERDPGRDPRRLQAEERAVEHEHEAVEDEAERERGERRGDGGRLRRREVAALVDDADDRLREHRADDARRDEQERDLPDAGRDRPAEAVEVGARREARERREEDGRDGDGEHPLRQHVEAERRVDRADRVEAVDQPRGEERVDDGVEVDQPEADRDRHHQHERLADRRVAPVDHDLQAAVAPAQPRQRQQELDQRRDQDRERVDVELRVDPVGARDADDEADDDRDVPERPASAPER